MNDNELREYCNNLLEHTGYLEFPDEILAEITHEQSVMLTREYSDSFLMKLPEKEILFFEWLKQNDIDVWLDLWEEAGQSLYQVGVSFLPLLLPKDSRGFPICDLQKNNNYYFTESHLTKQEAPILLDSVRKLFLAKQKLTAAQALLLEISIFPIDIWHFAYRHKISIESAKKAVAELVSDNILIHLTTAEELADFVVT